MPNNKFLSPSDIILHQWGHDITETKAKHWVLLNERIMPMLYDAIDALEIETPAPDVALRRMKAICKLISETKE